MKLTAPFSFHLHILLFSPLAPLHTADFSLVAKDKRAAEANAQRANGLNLN